MKRAHLSAVARRLGFFQIDSVNVLQRAHYLPLYSRLGPYDVELLHAAAGRAPRLLVEYWAHEAALVDVDLWPAMTHKMQSKHGMWGALARVGAEQPELIEAVYEQVGQFGPVTARELTIGAPPAENQPPRKGPGVRTPCFQTSFSAVCP